MATKIFCDGDEVIPHTASTPALSTAIANGPQSSQNIVDRDPGIAVVDLFGGDAINAAVATVFG